KLIARMPDVYRSPLATKKDEVRTVYVAPLGEATVFPGKQPIQFKDITDGTSNTILLVEVAEEQAVVWTKPDDLAIDSKDPAKGLTRAHRGGYPVAFADGSVRFIPDTISAKALYGYFTRSGGEVPGQ